jgi:predicted transcriptional regulator of viral defense system
VLAELAEKLDPRRLVQAAEAHVAVSVVQRTGLLLDQLGRAKLTDPLKAWLDEQRPTPTLLSPSHRAAGPRDERWRVVVNESFEVDA